MADQKSIAKIVSETKKLDLSMNPRLSMKLWLDDYDSDKGWPIEKKNILDFQLRESMFLKLPVGYFMYADDGMARNIDRFSAGRLLYIGFEYTQSDEDADEKNISVGCYRIQSVVMKNRSKGSVEYAVKFIYDALGLVNSVPKVPDQVIGESPSTDVLGDVCAQVGLTFKASVDTSDNQQWFNPSMTACDFVSYVVAHSFISERDFGMFWVSKNGEANYAGVRNSFENGIPFFFETDVNENLREKVKHVQYSDVVQVDLKNMDEEQLKAKYQERCWILFNEDQRNSDSWMSNWFGNSRDEGSYDPMFSTIAYKPQDITFEGAYMKRKLSYQPITGGVTPSDSTDRDVVGSSHFAGYTNFNLHPAWDYAPVHNKLMRMEFFSNRHTLTLNTGKQLKCFGDQELRIGDILDIDMSNPREGENAIDSMVDNGKYIIHTIDWFFQKDSDLYLQLRVSSDSLHPASSDKGTEDEKAE